METFACLYNSLAAQMTKTNMQKAKQDIQDQRSNHVCIKARPGRAEINT